MLSLVKKENNATLTEAYLAELKTLRGKVYRDCRVYSSAARSLLEAMELRFHWKKEFFDELSGELVMGHSYSALAMLDRECEIFENRATKLEKLERQLNQEESELLDLEEAVIDKEDTIDALKSEIKKLKQGKVKQSLF